MKFDFVGVSFATCLRTFAGRLQAGSLLSWSMCRFAHGSCGIIHCVLANDSIKAVSQVAECHLKVLCHCVETTVGRTVLTISFNTRHSKTLTHDTPINTINRINYNDEQLTESRVIDLTERRKDRYSSQCTSRFKLSRAKLSRFKEERGRES